MSATKQIEEIIDQQVMLAITKLSKTFKFDLDEANRVLELDPPKTKKESKKRPKKEPKAKSDEDKPKKKRAPTGYLVYSSATRPEVRAELTDVLDEGEKLKPQDVVRALAARWKDLDQEERDEWNTKAKTPDASDEELCLED